MSVLRRYLSVSTVIQKFLDTAHLPLLKQYMEKVAEDPSVMRPAYAAVLLSLYVQLRDGESLQKFIDRSISDKGYKWDVDEAISTCLNGTMPIVSRNRFLHAFCTVGPLIFASVTGSLTSIPSRLSLNTFVQLLPHWVFLQYQAPIQRS